MESDLRILFNEYEQKFDLYKKIKNNKLPRSLNLFNIRIRIAIDIQISFKKEVSFTNTKDVRETYALLIKLLEIWNAYEALLHLAKELNVYTEQNKSPFSLIPDPVLKKAKSLSILKKTAEDLKTKYSNDSKFKNDFRNFINKIKNDDRIKKKLTRSCENILDYFDNKKTITGSEIIALIYAKRNMYYHNGEASKIGMSYSSQQYLIKILMKVFYKHILLLATKILENEYQNIKLNS